MSIFRGVILPVTVAGIWINLSEFIRNEILAKSLWIEHFQRLNLEFPSAPINGAIWAIWGFSFAGIIFAVSTRFTLLQTTVMGWFMGFALMWMVAWNLAVLPLSILSIAVPLSLLEAFIAALICKKLSPH